MHKRSLNFPDALIKNRSPTYTPSSVKDCRFFSSSSSTNNKRSRSSARSPNKKSCSLTQQELLDRLQKYGHKYLREFANQLDKSQSVQNLHPQRPHTDNLMPSLRSQKHLPPINQGELRFSRSANQLTRLNKTTKVRNNNSRQTMSVSMSSSAKLVSHKPGVLSFGDTASSVDYSRVQSDNKPKLFVYRNNTKPIEKKKFANRISQKHEKLKKPGKKNRKRLKQKLSTKRRESIACSVDNLGLDNRDTSTDRPSSTDDSKSLVVKLRLPADEDDELSRDKKLVFNIESKTRHKSDVSQIIDKDTVDVDTTDCTSKSNETKLTAEKLKEFDQQSRTQNISKSQSVSEGGNLSRRSSLAKSGELSLDSLRRNVSQYSKHGDTDTVYLQNIGFTHRSSYTVQGNINNDEHGLGLFLAKVKHHLSDPTQKRLVKSKSALLLHDPKRIRDALTKLRTIKDPNVKWKDEIQLDDQLTNWRDEVSLFKVWCHRENWWKWMQV